MHKSRLAFPALALAALLVAPAAGAPRGADFADVAWIDGQARRIYGSFSVAPAVPGTVKVYVAGPVDEHHPLDEHTLDPHFPYVHDHVCPKVAFGQRQLATFNVLRPGPSATGANLRVRIVERIAGIDPIVTNLPITDTLDMPYAIDLGQGFVDLTSVAVVEAGIAAGILTTVQIAEYLDITGWTGGTIASE